MNKTIADRIVLLQKRQQLDWNPSRAASIFKLKKQAEYGLAGPPSKKDLKRLAGKFNEDVTTNATEKEFFDQAKKSGWVVSKKGWPDFFMWKEGKIALVEVKMNGHRLRENQEAILSALASYGVPCYVWTPKAGFTKVISNPDECIKLALIDSV